MKKQTGFTLIELLAVIVILAIIALIATPIVLNIIKDSKESATLQSAQFYIDAVEHSITKKIMDEPTFRPTSCDIQADGNLLCGTTEVVVEIKGEKPTSGTITLETGKIKEVTLVLSEKTITKNNEGKLVYGEPEVQLESGLYDAEGNLIATWDELVNEYGIDLENDWEPEFDENEEVINLLEIPGVILSTNEKLKQGTKLVIDSSVKRLGMGVLAYNTTLIEITITDSVTSIGIGTFSGSALPSIIIPNSVTSIGNGAFEGCESLTEVIIGNSVTSIGDSAFLRCTSLKEIIIPNSVTSIDEYVFSQCTSLEKVTIGNGVTSIGGRAFYNCLNIKEIILGNRVISIGTEAFYGCESLIKVIIPDSVRNIDAWAFCGNTNLKEIIIPNSVTSIGVGAFAQCISLKEIVLPNRITSIDIRTFSQCIGLEKITILNNITSIGFAAFYECTNLNTINYVGTEDQWNSISFGDIWDSNTPTNKVINYNYVIPQN